MGFMDMNQNSDGICQICSTFCSDLARQMSKFEWRKFSNSWMQVLQVWKVLQVLRLYKARWIYVQKVKQVKHTFHMLKMI